MNLAGNVPTARTPVHGLWSRLLTAVVLKNRSGQATVHRSGAAASRSVWLGLRAVQLAPIELIY